MNEWWDWTDSSHLWFYIPLCTLTRFKYIYLYIFTLIHNVVCVYKQKKEAELRERTHWWLSDTHLTEYRPTDEESESTKLVKQQELKTTVMFCRMVDKMRFSVWEREGSNSFKFSKIRINISQHVAITFTACKSKFYIKRTNRHKL